MDFRHLIVTCLFSKLRLPFDNQKVKENYAIFSNKHPEYGKQTPGVSEANARNKKRQDTTVSLFSYFSQ